MGTLIDEIITKDEQNERSEEVQDIIERMPTRWTFWIASIVSLIMFATIFMSCIIKYPDTVSGTITITMEEAPVRLVSHSSGYLHLLSDNMTEVKRYDCIGYLECGAEYNDVKLLDSLCHCNMDRNIVLDLPQNLKLGSLSIAYNNFVASYNSYDMLRKTKVYGNMRKALVSKRTSGIKVGENLKKELELNNKVLSVSKQSYSVDSVLYNAGALSEEALNMQRASVMSQEQSNLQLKSSKFNQEFDLSSIDIELAKIDINVYEELKTSFVSLVSSYNNLVNEIKQWKEHYMFIAPIDGRIEYLGFWRDNVFVQSAQELFTISPQNSNMIGELEISSFGAGKVEPGQSVNVKLNDYPYEEYGQIKGRVDYVSSLTHEVKSSEFSGNSYLVMVSFPHGLKTNYGKNIKANSEYKGFASIVTKKRRLIQRLFDNLKSKENK